MSKIPFILIFSAVCFGNEIGTQAAKESQFASLDLTSKSLEKSISKSKQTNFDYIHFLREKYPQSFSLGVSAMPNPKNDIFIQNSPERLYDPYFLDFDSSYVKNSSRTLKAYQKSFNFSDIYDGFRRFYQRYIK